jgi:acetyl-CoA C-acetyltransferase
VDQGAAVILMSEDAARRYLPGKRHRVYFLGGGYAEDRQRFMVQKSDFTASPPLRAAVGKALKRACTVLEAVDCFDLYSCFPCAVSIAKRMIGIPDDDPRPLTLTGGLGFFGGPGNNYNLHAVATLAERIAAGQSDRGMVTALGWFMHKQAVGVYGSAPHGRDIRDDHRLDQADPLAGEDPVAVRDAFTGVGTIDTYTIIYQPDQAPSHGVIYGTTPEGDRFVAAAPNDPDVFAWLTEKNRIGQAIRIRFDRSSGVNRLDGFSGTVE